MNRSRSLVGVCVVGALLLASCGDDDDDGGSAATTGDTATTGSDAAVDAPATTGGGGTTADGTAAEGGDAATPAAPVAADPDQPPVIVSFNNLEGGAISLPEIRLGFESGVNYVNEELGGINGRPVEVHYCNLDITPESSVNCANETVEANAVAAIQGVDVAGDAALPVLRQANIAEIGFFAFSPGMNQAVGDAFFTLFSNEDNYASDLVVQQQLGAENVAVVMADLPTSHALDEDVIQPAAEKLGMEATAFYFPTSVDWTAYAATIVAAGVDGVSFPAEQDPVCLAAIPALRAAGFTGTIHAGSCTQIAEDLDAEMLENVINHNEFYYQTFTDIPAKAQQDLDIYQRFIDRDFPEHESALYTQLGFHIAVQMADMIRQVDGEITPESVKATLPTTKGESFFRDAGDGYDCAGADNWPGTTACANSEVYTKFTADKLKEVLPNQPTDLSAVRPAD